MKLLLTALILTLSLLVDRALPINYSTNNASSSMTIEGTSTLHDWEMKAEDLQGTMNVDLYENELKIKELKLVVPVESLKSGKGPMDDNAYRALKEPTYPNITYEMVLVKEISKLSEGVYEVTTVGDLTVAGKTRRLILPIKAKVVEGGIELTGATAFTMSSFNVEAPSFMMGTITTGDKITIKFSINYN
ncbi:MAG: polyisoprenoid-binding protein YceI [Roseivirga sp.]|jgi:polyisoprenoid-binding protein YceI